MRCTSFLLLLACGDAWTGTHLTTPFVRPAARRGSSFGHFALTGGVNTAEDASESSLPPGVSARGRELCGMLGGVNVYLVGMMGSGKSSVGDTLAQRMGALVCSSAGLVARETTTGKGDEERGGSLHGWCGGDVGEERARYIVVRATTNVVDPPWRFGRVTRRVCRCVPSSPHSFCPPRQASTRSSTPTR